MARSSPGQQRGSGTQDEKSPKSRSTQHLMDGNTDEHGYRRGKAGHHGQSASSVGRLDRLQQPPGYCGSHEDTGHRAAEKEVERRIEIGVTGRAEEIDGDRLFRVDGGYGVLVEALVERLARAGGELRLGARVEKVAWRRGSVEISARGALGVRLPPVRGCW